MVTTIAPERQGHPTSGDSDVNRNLTDEVELPHNLTKRSPSVASKRRTGPLVLSAVLLIVTIVGCFNYRGTIINWANGTPDVDAEISLPTIKSAFALGRLEPEGEVVSVSGPNGSGDARIQELKVAIGARVDEGHVLAVLDNNASLRAAHSVARTKLEQSEQRLRQTRLNASTTITELQASLESSSARLKMAKLELARQTNLMEAQATARQQYESAQLDVETAQSSLREAESRLARYAKTEDESIDVRVAISDLAVAKASLHEAEVRLDRSYIRAPFAGTILDLELRPGERTSSGILLKMGRIDSMMVRAEVYESDVASIRPDQQVTVRSSSLKEPLNGKVEAIATFVKRQSIVNSMPAANTDARVVDVLIRLEKSSSALASQFVGMQVRVEFEL